MSIPNNITKEHILEAIEAIEVENIPNIRLSKEYYLDYGGKILPPKYVISIANKYPNNIELGSNSFNAVEAKNFLERMNFVIITNEKDEDPKFWIEKTIVKGRPDRESGNRAIGKALWSPQRDKRGADIYKNMRLVKESDIIIHLIDNKYISGISIVKKKAIKTNGVSGTAWEGPAYLIELQGNVKLKPKIFKGEILNEKYQKLLDEISNDTEVFYNKSLNLRQGAYLTPCSHSLAALINQLYLLKSGENLPYFNTKMRDKLDFKISEFILGVNQSGLLFSKKTINRFVSSLITKPFVILSGLSGSGKTKLAQAFVQWICGNENHYKIVPVGADWTNREPLLGYPNALDQQEYIKSDNGVVDLILNAHNNTHLPHFLILDEMNLSHVERYFADFLSVMESNGKISFHSGEKEKSGVPAAVTMPDNLFIIGTINVDETTYMFSPKVLDRANVIEFRILDEEIGQFLENPLKPELDKLDGKGAEMAESFMEMARTKEFKNPANGELNKTLITFFGELKKTGAEFGYRSAFEILRLINQLTVIDSGLNDEAKLDIAIMQKLLPKLHGSRRKLCPVLVTLGRFCIDKNIITDIEKTVFEPDEFDFNSEGILYPLSLEKITRLHKGAVDNGFASYAEA